MMSHFCKLFLTILIFDKLLPIKTTEHTNLAVMERWRGKTAVVTGASAGIGASISITLADAGLHVIGLARRSNLIDNLQSAVRGEGKITSRQCDISKPNEVAAAFKWIDDTFGGIHIIINNAGITVNGQITDVGDQPLNEDALLSTIDINLKGTVICTKHAVASMKRYNFDGHIININSVSGHYIPFTDVLNVYPSTKYGITAFTASLNNELASFNSRIKTTSISPGLVMTELFKRSPVANLSLPILQPNDVADAVMYVLSTPPNVNINELTISSVTEKWL